MIIWTTRFSRKKAVFAVILMGVVMAVLIILTGRTAKEEAAPPPQLSDNAQRVEYLRTLGWEVVPEPVETLQFLMADTLEEPYLTYNQLQLSQGFDLAPCCGKQVSRYTYSVTNYPNRPSDVLANLYVCEERPVGGDIICPGVNGFQESLVRSTEAQQ